MIPALLLLAQVITPAGSPKPVGPYSPGIAAGDYVYVSGQGARDGNNRMAATVEGRIRQTLTNVKAIVEAAGLTMDHVVYTQVYLHESTPAEAVDGLWKEFFPKGGPARSMLGVHRMPTDTPVEINAVAYRDAARTRVFNSPAGRAVQAGNRIYLSGVFGATAEEALGKLEAQLKSAGVGFEHLVFVNPYLAPGVEIAAMNRDYAKRFTLGDTPARATIPVAFLPGGAKVEFTGVAVADRKDRWPVRPKNMEPSATASPCVWAFDRGVNDTLYCSAKSGFVPGINGGIYADTVEHQVVQSMRNLLDGLEEAGLDFSHVVASNVYVDQLDEFARMNGVYAKYFKAAPPTRTTVAPVPPVVRQRTASGHFPKLEEVSVVAVRVR